MRAVKISTIGENPEISKVYIIDSSNNIKGLGIKINDKETLLEALTRTDYLKEFPNKDNLTENIVSNIQPPKYFQRINREYRFYPKSEPNVFFNFDNSQRIYPPINLNKVAGTTRQIITLINRLEEIFNFIEPEESNLKSFGHETRNLIIISCTEIEAQLKGILKTNNIAPIRNYHSMQDYYQLLDVLGLNKYELRFLEHPQLGNLAPFKNWNPAKTNGKWFSGMDWYDSYNAIKHDREGEFLNSKLIYAINSVLACIILLDAQFGGNATLPNIIDTKFKITKRPELPIILVSNGKEKFENSNWTPVNYELI